MKNIFKLIFSGALLYNITIQAQEMPAKSADRPNIVFFITDDQSQLDVSVYGAPELLQTPNAETIANDGMVFENAFIASPACAPSRAALLTGLMPARNGAEENHSQPSSKDMHITKVLQAAGYNVAAFGKVAHGDSDPDKGFDFHDNVRKRGDLTGAVKEYYNDLNDKSKPQCIMVGDRRPHVGWISNSIYDSDDVTLPPYLIDTKETREHWARYLTDVTGLDNEMGKLYQWTNETFGSNFIFIYTSDHGAQWPFGKWNLYDAGTKVPLIMVWPDSIAANTRTEAMISWVDIFPTLFECSGVEIPDNLDGQSFKQVLTGDKTEHHEYLFTTTSGDGTKNVYPIRSIRSKKYKFIWNVYPEYCHTNHSDLDRYDGAGAYWDSWDASAREDSGAWEVVHKYYVRPEEEFFDLEVDSLEQVNLIDDPEMKDEIDTMRALLMDWIEEQGDQLTVFNTPRIAGEYLPEFTDPNYVPDTTPESAELLFHFPFNGSLVETANNYQLAATGTADFTEGYHGQALKLNGTSDYFDLNTTGILNTGTTSFTICAWVFNTDTVSPDDNEEIVLHQLNGRILLENVLVDDASTLGTMVGKSLSTASGSPFETNKWTHIAISSNPETRRHVFYMNGVAIDSAVTADDFESNENGFRIGAHKRGDKGFWHGFLDELYLYEGVLSSKEINNLKNYGQLTVQRKLMANADFSVYPNPADNVVHVLANEIPRHISLYSISGEHVLSAQNTRTLNTTELKGGIYFIHTTFNNGVINISKAIISK